MGAKIVNRTLFAGELPDFGFWITDFGLEIYRPIVGVGNPKSGNPKSKIRSPFALPSTRSDRTIGSIDVSRRG
jgi:hypothetical protein